MWRRFVRDRRGAVAILSGLAMTSAVAAAAIAIDAGSLYSARRAAQGAVDLAAMAAARDLSHAEAAARATLEANGVNEIERITVTLGRYEADASLPPEARFSPGAAPANAARVELRNRAPLYFGRFVMLQTSLPIETRAVASTTAMASFSIGSRLASLDGGVLNAVLSGLLGGGISLTAMDYRALADLDVGLLDFADALATTLNVTAGSYADLLATQARVGDILSALVLVAQGDAAATAALRAMKAQSQAANLAIVPKTLVDLGPYAHLGLGEEVAAGAARVSALDLIRTAADIANGGRQVDVNLGLAVPGLLSLTAKLAVGERPQGTSWIALGRDGASVYTAQTRLRLVAEVGGSGLLAGARIRVPIHADIAAAKATLSSISCGMEPETDARVGVTARPSLARLWIGEPRNAAAFWSFTGAAVMDPATLVTVPLLTRVTGRADAEVTNVADMAMAFTMADIRDGTARTVKTRDFTATLLPTLIGRLDLDVTLLGLPLGGLLKAVETLVLALVAPLSTALDPVLNAVLDLLGVGLGEADVTVHGVRCDGAALVG